MSFTCNVCASDTLAHLYTLDDSAVDSLRSTGAQETRIGFCTTCGHTITEPLKNVEEFYDKSYNILTGSEDEDQLLKIVDGIKIFRSDFQVDTLMKAVDFRPGMRVLDYGCAKAATLKKLLAKCAVTPFTFDVSDNYRPFWEGTIAPENQATHHLPASWNGTMDVVYSFFCLEHVAEPVAAMKAKFDLLKEGGTCYFVVPNFHTNVADVLVLDHINHFAECSLHYAMALAGFSHIHIDGTTQAGWWIVNAQRSGTATATLPSPTEITQASESAHRITRYWKTITDGIEQLSVAAGTHTAIYGAGFYGTYAALHLPKSVAIDCFIDANSFLQGTTHLGKAVLAPAQLPANVTKLLVALNPAHARKTMAAIDAWKSRDLSYEFIFQDDA